MVAVTDDQHWTQHLHMKRLMACNEVMQGGDQSQMTHGKKVEFGDSREISDVRCSDI